MSTIASFIVIMLVGIGCQWDATAYLEDPVAHDDTSDVKGGSEAVSTDTNGDFDAYETTDSTMWDSMDTAATGDVVVLTFRIHIPIEVMGNTEELCIILNPMSLNRTTRGDCQKNPKIVPGEVFIMEITDVIPEAEQGNYQASAMLKMKQEGGHPDMEPVFNYSGFSPQPILLQSGAAIAVSEDIYLTPYLP